MFLTGAAGTGKSHLLNYYLADKPSELFPVVASTGAAAVLIGGRTFHSFFGLGLGEGGPEATVARAVRNRRLARRLQRACAVVIDEVSMLSGETLATAERIACAVRQSAAPWGGLRIVAVGDFAQLPPVAGPGQVKDWAFLHPVWQRTAFQPALLSTVMRTQDTDFLDILNFVRSGTVNDEVTTFLDARSTDGLDEVPGTRLYAHRAKADLFNDRQLAEIAGHEHAFETEFTCDERGIEACRRSLPIPQVLRLKLGAFVMLRRNDASEDRLYVNGSLGTVRNISADVIHVALLSGSTVAIEREKFSTLDGDGNEIAAAWNFPLSLAWASTIHKAQGASLDRAVVDLSALWEPGQAYVALSRVRSGDGLAVERWSASSIRAEPRVTEFYDALAVEMKTYTPRPFFEPTFTTRSLQATPVTEGVRQRRAEQIARQLREQVPFEAIVEASGVKVDRVLLYIEELLESGAVPSVRYLTADHPDRADVEAAFQEYGTDRLRPVFEALEERVPYATIRLIRCGLHGSAL